jgi:hypothetical protein
MPEFDAFADDDEPKAPAPVEEVPRKRGRPPGSGKKPAAVREGTKHVGGYFQIQVSTELQRICIEQEEKTRKKKTIQALVAEGINSVFLKYGRQPIASED